MVMSDKDLARVREMFSSISETGQIDMRKRACDKIKELANDPRNSEHRPILLGLLGVIATLPVEK